MDGDGELFQEYFPLWKELSKQQQEYILSSVVERKAEKGRIVHNGNLECTGLLLIKSGQLRAYFLSDEGREITLYRLLERDLCLLSAACMLNSIQFEIIIEAEKDTDFWVIPPAVYKQLMEESAAVSNYTNEIMASRFSDVMWLMEQVLWKSMDKRIAGFLLEEANHENDSRLKLTHETIANHLGTHREVVTRLLRYFQNEKMVMLSRGTIELLDESRLRQIAY